MQFSLLTSHPCGRHPHLSRTMCISILLFLSVLLSMASAISPGDEHSFCTDTLINDNEITPPQYPSNAKILMDSYNYIDLLPPHEFAVWMQVDNDNNNVGGTGTMWLQASNNPCRQIVNVCGFGSGPQDNWVITQYINRTVNGSHLPQVSVQVEFQLRSCDDLSCQRTFLLNAFETDRVDNITAATVSNYRLISRVAPADDSGQTIQNQTKELNFRTNADGFYLAITDETSCFAVTRVIVFYNICPGETETLVVRPETLAPPIDRLSTPRQVTAECVAGASPENGVAAKLTCAQGGVWSSVSGSGCRCNPGLRGDENGLSCIPRCGAGMYFSVVFQECRMCPENSNGTMAGLSVCQCVEGYYRLSGEEDRPCTKPPSAPRNVRITSQTSDSITLAWDPPADLGGRNDITYILWYQVVGSDNFTMITGVSGTMGTIEGLSPDEEYTVFVSATNGVSMYTNNSMNGSLLVQGRTIASTKEESSTVGVVAGVLVFAILVTVLLIIVIAVVIIYRTRPGIFAKYIIQSNSHDAVPIPVKGHRTYVDPGTYASPDEAIEEFAKEIEPKTLRLDSEIGAGEFGTVFRGIWKESPKKQVAVAVKTLKAGSSGKMREDFLNEASIMGQFQHDHVIKLYGVVTKVDPAMIVMEFMANGSLYSYLRKNDEKLNTQRLLSMARGVCSGMEYLSAVGYVHRDLAARNVLVCQDEVCKVADFGLSREVIDDEYNVQKGGKIPVRWTAPEAIYRRKFTSSSDVWSFGVLMWEVMTYAQHPYEDWDNQTVLDKLELGYRLTIPHGCPEEVYDIMLSCWNKELSLRPSFTDVLKKLNHLLITDSPPKRLHKKVRSSGNYAHPLQCKSVEDWLESVKMDRYIPMFQDNGINSVNQLVHLTESDLREMGITLAGHLHRLTQSIESGYMELKRSSSVASP